MQVSKLSSHFPELCGELPAGLPSGRQERAPATLSFHASPLDPWVAGWFALRSDLAGLWRGDLTSNSFEEFASVASC